MVGQQNQINDHREAERKEGIKGGKNEGEELRKDTEGRKDGRK